MCTSTSITDSEYQSRELGFHKIPGYRLPIWFIRPSDRDAIKAATFRRSVFELLFISDLCVSSGIWVVSNHLAIKANQNDDKHALLQSKFNMHATTVRCKWGGGHKNNGKQRGIVAYDGSVSAPLRGEKRDGATVGNGMLKQRNRSRSCGVIGIVAPAAKRATPAQLSPK
ncbi:hypothetical protein B0H19DRAFT_1078676 [Mycena capillaripes]|nr:hypothetical protein B0H19DRAFT_1078676 [Mycena capillaripes]